MDEGTPLGGLESEDDAKPSHGLHAIFSSLWGRGYLAHRLRIRLPEDEGIRRPKQPDQPRRLTGPAGRGSGHGLTTLDACTAPTAVPPARVRLTAAKSSLGRHRKLRLARPQGSDSTSTMEDGLRLARPQGSDSTSTSDDDLRLA
jgi:hypothetical protein